MHDSDDHDLIDKLVNSLIEAIGDETVSVANQYSIIEGNQKALDLLDLIFYIVIGILMFLCFFSL